MVGTTLAEIRAHVESLATQDGPYLVRCGRTGERPIPVAGKRFESRLLAERAASAGTQYRAALRRYDPQLPYYDLIVTEDSEAFDSRSRDERCVSESIRPAGTAVSSPLVEFCHRVAASVFETLCDAGYRAVETAVMDAYFELAETVQDPHELCLCLVESMAAELDQQLTLPEQVELLAEAATRLPPVESADCSVASTLETLERRGLFASYTQSPSTVDLDAGTRSVVVRVSEYALTPRHGRLAVLPVVLELYRRRPAWPLSSLRVSTVDDQQNRNRWELTLVQSRDCDPTEFVDGTTVTSLTNARIDEA